MVGSLCSKGDRERKPGYQVSGPTFQRNFEQHIQHVFRDAHLESKKIYIFQLSCTGLHCYAKVNLLVKGSTNGLWVGVFFAFVS